MSVDGLDWPVQGKEYSDACFCIEQLALKDHTYTSGRILGAMTTEPHPLAREILGKYAERNLGDAGLVPGTAEAEVVAVSRMVSLLGGEGWGGNFVSGGTEANILAVYLARKQFSHVRAPEIIASDAAHVSFDKAAELLGVRLVRLPLDAGYYCEPAAYEAAVNENTIGVIGIAGTTALGLVEPLEAIGVIAKKHGLFYHIDGAYGGLVLPFIKNAPRFDLGLPGLCSYTVDPHKMGMSVIPGGVLLVKDADACSHGFTIPYLAGGAVTSLTLTGTRPGAPVLAFLALSEHLGREGYQQVVDECMANTAFLLASITDMPGIRAAAEPQMNVLGLKADMSARVLNARLREKGWILGLFAHLDLLRIVLMPHITRQHIEDFLQDLHAIAVKNSA